MLTPEVALVISGIFTTISTIVGIWLNHQSQMRAEQRLQKAQDEADEAAENGRLQSAKQMDVTFLRDEVKRLSDRLKASEDRLTVVENKNLALLADVLLLKQFARDLIARLRARGETDVPDLPRLSSDGLNA